MKIFKNKILLTFMITLFLLIYFPLQAEKSELPKTNDKISLEVKGMDIVDVLKMISNRSGINIVIGRNVIGKVNLFLKDVNIWDAFEIILLSNDLAYEKKGDIINVMTQKDYELVHGEQYQDKKLVSSIKLKYAKAAEVAKMLVQVKSTTGKVILDDNSNTIVLIDSQARLQKMEEIINRIDSPLKTEIFDLNYAKAEKLFAKLQETVTKGIGSIRFDERTNKIIVTDYPQKVEQIAGMIKAFDEKISQVLIDSQVIQITPSDVFEMGVDWNFWITKYFQMKAVLPVGANANRLVFGTTSAEPARPGQYKAIIDILRTIGDTKVLSSPRIMALNNEEAKIHVGTREAYITSTISQAGTGTTVTSQTVNFVDTGIKLAVTPTISRDGFVTMKIKPEISDAVTQEILSEGQRTSVPIVTSSEAETTVTVKDGVTIIIGGLKKEEREKTVKKIPLLGDIPGLGFLFRSTKDDTNSTELVILLTPHIMTGEKAFTDFEQARPASGMVADMQAGQIVTETINPDGVYMDYYKLLKEKIINFAKMHPPEREIKGRVDLSFVLSSEGALLSEPQILEVTNSGLVPFAKEALKGASPFPAFPTNLHKMKESFKVSLEYK